MVADQDIGSCVDEPVCLHTLARYGLEGVLTAPVETDDDDGGGVSFT